MSNFLGMRSTADWAPDERPKSWREMILYLYPNGAAALTAILSLMSKSPTTDPEFYWWTQTLESVSGEIAGIFTDTDMSAAYVSGAASGNTLYVQCGEELASQIREGHQLLLRYSLDSRVDVNAKVVSSIINGDNSSIAVRLLEDDDNSPAYDLSDADRLIVIGNINPEGGEMPSAIAKNPTKFYNRTQIFRTPLDITRTARKTKLRTEDSYQRAKREALEMHGIEMEWNTLFGIQTERAGANGKPERTTMGIVPFVRANAAANFGDYRYATNGVTAGADWVADGRDWLDAMFEQLARYAMLDDMIWLCGSGAVAGINALAKEYGTIQLTPETASFGLRVLNWITPYGTISLKTHPLMSQEASTRNMMIGVTPRDIELRYIDDTTFFADGEKQNTGHGRIDGTKEEYLTEAGYEYDHPEHFMVLDGIGQKNLL